MVWIKICGLKTPEAALTCVNSGADALGFVFAASKRRITVDQAAIIINKVPRKVSTVGVFVDAPLHQVLAAQYKLGLDLIQLHGSETPEYCSRLPVKVIKAFQIASLRDLQAVSAYRGKIWACLLDSRISGASGGTGRTWNWELLQSDRPVVDPGMRIIVAGGLTPTNVSSALQQLNPCGVDASSGVETGGQKDNQLILKFIKVVRRWEQSGLR